MTAIIPAWLKEILEQSLMVSAKNPSSSAEHAKVFLKQGLPDKKHERFKYTDFSCLAKQTFTLAKPSKRAQFKDYIKMYRMQFPNVHLLVLINGYFSKEFSDSLEEETGLTICLGSAECDAKLTSTPKHLDGSYPFANLALALSRDGLCIKVEKDFRPDKIIHVLSIVDTDHVMVNLHHRITLDAHAKLKISFHHQAFNAKDYFINQRLDMCVAEQADLDYCKIQNDPAAGIHLSQVVVEQKACSTTNLKTFSLGSQFVRDDIHVYLQKEQASCQATGFYYTQQEGQYVDNHIDIIHDAPSTQSDMLYKGILQNNSRAVFNGKVYVAQHAQKTLAYQANHNLLLSDTAEVNAKPELEIYADDVKCKHGATIGQIDPDALFYLRSRNISEKAALNMLLRGFANEVIERVSHPYLKSLTEASIANHDD